MDPSARACAETAGGGGGESKHWFDWFDDVAVEPLIKVSNQLVAAPAHSDVVIQCYVEAAPKAMNNWWRESGENQ